MIFNELDLNIPSDAKIDDYRKFEDSDNYIERVYGEYAILTIRTQKLRKFIDKADTAVRDMTVEQMLLIEQMVQMNAYRKTLEKRIRRMM
ncbi:hypothetical protein [Bacteroides acidifaciens]|uniref:crAss001_48 related protein n=1 Tax=Bacteroides acidifaciens TaxID=85831 RepID=UPI0025ADAF56|nr:hypothetical protein [Bacteroides acidifaciens]